MEPAALAARNVVAGDAHDDLHRVDERKPNPCITSKHDWIGVATGGSAGGTAKRIGVSSALQKMPPKIGSARMTYIFC